MGRKRSFRSWEQSAIAGVLLAVVLAFGGFVYLTPNPNQPDSIATELALGGYELFWICLLFRMAFAAIVVNDRRVTVRNVCSTRHFSWDEIDRFALGIEHLTPFKFAAALWTKDGKEVTIFAIQEPNFNMWFQRQETSASRKVDELNRILNDQRASVSKLPPQSP